jgi:putative aldouronate transport system substrate-binding protein
MLNYWHDGAANPNPKLAGNPEKGIDYWPYALVKAIGTRKNVYAHRDVKAALTGAQDPAKLGREPKFYYDRIQDWFKKGDVEGNGWSFYRSFGNDGSGMENVDRYLTENKLKSTEFLGGSTATMAEKMATLNKMESVMTIKIILGQTGIEEFDKFVKDWHELGGTQITKEVNEWAEAVK